MNSNRPIPVGRKLLDDNRKSGSPASSPSRTGTKPGSSKLITARGSPSQPCERCTDRRCSTTIMKRTTAHITNASALAHDTTNRPTDIVQHAKLRGWCCEIKKTSTQIATVSPKSYGTAPVNQ